MYDEERKIFVIHFLCAVPCRRNIPQEHEARRVVGKVVPPARLLRALRILQEQGKQGGEYEYFKDNKLEKNIRKRRK